MLQKFTTEDVSPEVAKQALEYLESVSEVERAFPSEVQVFSPLIYRAEVPSLTICTVKAWVQQFCPVVIRRV